MSTVRTHLHNVYRKIGAVDRAQAVLIARDRGWTDKHAQSIRPERRADRDGVGAVAGLEAGEGGLGVGADRLGAEAEPLGDCRSVEWPSAMSCRISRWRRVSGAPRPLAAGSMKVSASAAASTACSAPPGASSSRRRPRRRR